MTRFNYIANNRKLGPSRGRHIYGVVVALLLAALLNGCVSVYTNNGKLAAFRHGDLAATEGLSIAVLPLENFSATPNAGVIIAQLLSTELYAQGISKQPGEEAVRGYLQTNKVEKDRIFTADGSHVLGQKLKVAAVLTGTVIEYSYQHGLRADPIVSLVLSLVRSSDGQVLWKVSHSLRGSLLGSRETLASTSKRLVQQLISNLLASNQT